MLSTIQTPPFRKRSQVHFIIRLFNRYFHFLNGMSSDHLLFANRLEFANDYQLTERASIYCILRHGNKTAKTHILLNCDKYPSWEQYFRLSRGKEEKTIAIEVIESKAKADDLLLGKGSVDLSKIGKSTRSLWINIMNEEAVIAEFVMNIEIQPREFPDRYSDFTLENSKAQAAMYQPTRAAQVSQMSFEKSISGKSSESKDTLGSTIKKILLFPLRIPINFVFSKVKKDEKKKFAKPALDEDLVSLIETEKNDSDNYRIEID